MIAVLFAVSLSDVSVSVDMSNITNSRVNKNWMGCHSDYGFEQTPRGFYAELMYGSFFGPGTFDNYPWSPRNATIKTDRGESFSSKPSLRLETDLTKKGAGMYNRGIGGEGLSLQAGKPYTFRAWVWQEADLEMFAELRDFTKGTSLARKEFDVVASGPPWGATWKLVNFTLTPNAGTSCVGIAPGSDPTIECLGSHGGAHPCVRCGGELVVGVASASEAPSHVADDISTTRDVLLLSKYSATCSSPFGNYFWIPKADLQCLGMPVAGCDGGNCGSLLVNGSQFSVGSINVNDGHDACGYCSGCDTAFVAGANKVKGKFVPGEFASLTYTPPHSASLRADEAPCPPLPPRVPTSPPSPSPPPTKATVHLGMVSLMPSSWGLLQDKDGKDLPVLKSAADTLKQMGIQLIRSGGSVSQSMRWKDWRGPAWNRPSNQQVWGKSLIAGWGPFEVVDMCNALDIVPIITLAYDTNTELDWADLVEYAWGDSKITSWGRQRAEDGHPQPYNVTAFELGNEQYNPNFIAQVAAMEERAKQLSAAQPHAPVPPLQYIFPSNDGLSQADMGAAVEAGLPIERLMPDIHVGAGGAVEKSRAHFAGGADWKDSTVNLETNAGTHHLGRALNEAADLIDFFTAEASTTERIFARTASFCSGSASQFDSWDQGISFFLPNMTWLQPPGYVHQAIDVTWAEKTVAATFDGGSETIPLAAQLQESGDLVVRAVNKESKSVTLNVALSSQGAGYLRRGKKEVAWGQFVSDVDIYTIQGDDLELDNTPAEPTKVKLVHTKMGNAKHGGRSSSSRNNSELATVVSIQNRTITATLPKYSFVVLVIKL